MPLQYRIFHADGTGVSGAGGPPSVHQASLLVPPGLVSPYQGQGDKYVYRKYFLQITEFSDVTGLPVISSVDVVNETTTTADIVFNLNEPCITEIGYGTTPNGYGSNTIYVGGISYVSGDQTGNLTSLEEDTLYYFRISATDQDDNYTQYLGTFNTTDGTAPVFIGSPVLTNITSTSAAINWVTDEPSTSKVKYGTTSAITSDSNYDTTLVTSHRRFLTSLTPFTEYFYAPVSVDNAGNSGQYTPTLRFTTLEEGEGNPALTITSVTDSAATTTGATITWFTNNPADTSILYSPLRLDVTGDPVNQGGQMLSYYSDILGTGHTGVITNCAPGFDYYYKVQSADIYGQTLLDPIGASAYTFSTVADSIIAISNSGSIPSPVGAFVAFFTDENATGYVRWSKNNTEFISGQTGNVNEMTHAFTINGLIGNTRYYYIIGAYNGLGHVSDNNTVYEFTTTDIYPPTISTWSTGGNDNSLTFNWITTERCSTDASITRVSNGSTIQGNGTQNVFSHNVTFNSLPSETQYTFEFSSSDAAGNETGITGYISTLASVTGPDTNRPIISNVTHSTSDTVAYVSWITDEVSTSSVEYTTSAFPGTTETTFNEETTNHAVTIDGLQPETTYNFRVKSQDEAGNIATGNVDSFTMDAAPGSSSFAPGDTVAWLEWEVPTSITSMTSTYIPIRATIPVQSSADYTLPWYTEYGHYCQREVIKRDGGDNPKIVEVVFPFPLATAVAAGAGTKLVIGIEAGSLPASPPWDTFAIPSDLEVRMTLPDGQISTATLDPNQTPAANKEVVRGNAVSALPGETFPYCRTVRIYNRCTLQGTITAQTGPEAESIGVHAYITYWNKIWFTDFYPQIDIRLSNAHVNTASPTRRGGIYYKNISIPNPVEIPDGVQLELVMDLDIKTSAKTTTGMALVQDPTRCTPNPQPRPDLSPSPILGGSFQNYTLLYANDQSNHFFFQASTLDFRLALCQKGTEAPQIANRTQQKQLARLDHIAYCFLNENSPSTLLTARSWSTCRSSGPHNTYLPTLSSAYAWGGFTGRTAREERCKQTYNTIVQNLAEGTYRYTTLAGSPPDNPSASNAHPVQYGPYRPWGGEEGGVETGGYAIALWHLINFSKYEVLMYLYLNRMMKARHFQSQYNSYGLPVSVWDIRVPGNDSTLGQTSGTSNTGVNLGWTINQQVYLDDVSGTSLLPYITPVGGNDYMQAPWNSPTVAVTSNHSYAAGEGCSYHDDRTSYGAVYTQLEGFTVYAQNGRYHLQQYKSFDHQHQIKHWGAVCGLVEMTNDCLLKDDLLAQAHLNTISMGQYSTTNTSSVTTYNLAEIYYGYWRNSGQATGVGSITQPNQGLAFGRTFAWPLFFIVAAYQLGNSYHRPILLENLKFWGKVANNSLLPIGCLTRHGPGVPQNNLQHYGITLNPVKAYLRDLSSNWAGNGSGLDGWKLASVYNSTSAEYIDVNLTATSGETLIDKWAITLDYNVDSLYGFSYQYQAGSGNPILRINNWITRWKLNASVQRVAGPGTSGAQISVKAFLRNAAGTEWQITDSVTGTNGFTIGGNKVNITMNPRQVQPQGLPGNAGPDIYDQSFSIQSGLRLVFKIYATPIGLGALETNTIRLYMGSVDPLVITTTLEKGNATIYDANQVFETHMMNSSLVALSRNVLADQPDDTVSTNILTSIRRFYHDFYSVPPADLVNGGINHSTPWVKFSNGYAESWIIGVAKNINYPPGNDTTPFSTIVTEQGRYSNFPTDSLHYAPWSSYIGMLAEEGLGVEFTTSLSTTPYTPGFLLDKWCKMGTAHSTAIAHRNYLEGLVSSSDSVQLAAAGHGAGVIAHINYKTMMGGLLATSSTEVAPKVRVFLMDESSPGRIQIAATPYREDRMVAGSVLAGSQAEAEWVDGGTTVERPDFKFARGAGNAVVLYNNEGELGGDVNVSTDLTDSIPFWVRYRLDENQSSNDGYLRFGVLAGEGAVGGGNSNQADPDPVQPGDQVLWSDPSGDMVVQFGTERVPATTNAINKVGNTYYFNYNGNDEALQYVLSFDTNSGNNSGLIRIYETYSDSWPVYNGGLSYRNAGGLLYTHSGALNTHAYTSLRPGYPRKSTDGTEVVAEYDTTLDGHRYSRYTFLQTGKCLRITMEATDLDTNYSGSFYSASIGIASGVESPVYMEIGGAGNIPIIMFNGPSTDKYFWGGHLDPTQSNGHYTYLTYNPSGSAPGTMSGTNWFTNPMYTNYVAMDNGKINASLSETFGVGVSKTSKDLYVKSTSPVSPYREDSEGDFVVLLASNPRAPYFASWVTGDRAHIDEFKFMTGCYMEDLSVWAFSFWSNNFDNDTLGASPWYSPAIDSTNFATMCQFVRNQDWKMGGYVLYTTIESGNPWFGTGYLCGDGVGGYEKVVAQSTRGTLATGYALSYDQGLDFIETDSQLIKSAYNWNLAMYDVETYSMNGAMVNRFDKRSTAAVRTNRDFIINQKLAFDTIRRTYDGPLYGEGALSSHSFDAHWLWGGWIDSTYRNVTTNSFPMFNPVWTATSGHVRCPTRWWNAVDYEWQVLVPQQINQGLSFDDRFWTASDYDVARVRTGYFHLQDMWPYTTGAHDRVRAYRMMWGRGPSYGTNGDIDGDGNYSTHEGLVVDYYLTKGISDRMFSSPVETIKYKTGSLWSGFDDIIKVSSNLQTFCRIPVNITLQDGFTMYINPSTGSFELNLSNGDQYSLYQDGFLAYDQNGTFVAFTAAPTNTSYGASDNVISYVYDPGKYEAFYGRNIEERFGNISTAGNNLKQFKVWNYTHTGTVQTETGVGYTYPQVFTYQGLI